MHVLVVDDESGIREVSARILSDAGFTVDVAADGELAWEALGRNHYDLIVTDENMPNLNGLGLIGRMRRAHLFMPVILMSGFNPVKPGMREEDLPDAVLTKPFSILHLVYEVNRQLAVA